MCELFSKLSIIVQTQQSKKNLNLNVLTSQAMCLPSLQDEWNGCPFRNMWSHDQLLLWFSRKQGWHYLSLGTNYPTLRYVVICTLLNTLLFSVYNIKCILYKCIRVNIQLLIVMAIPSSIHSKVMFTLKVSQRCQCFLWTDVWITLLSLLTGNSPPPPLIISRPMGNTKRQGEFYPF